jgi:hypothetical protein
VDPPELHVIPWRTCLVLVAAMGGLRLLLSDVAERGYTRAGPPAPSATAAPTSEEAEGSGFLELSLDARTASLLSLMALMLRPEPSSVSPRESSLFVGRLAPWSSVSTRAAPSLPPLCGIESNISNCLRNLRSCFRSRLEVRRASP